ncbi:MAG: vitamin K epoxide reductase family protein [Parcubacteria group bacterium]|nr:vitamin K epoxide reductase family protein [Parcubacteria group bacterium]
MTSRFPQVIIALATLGIADTLYLYVSHVRGDSLACSILDGCNVVAASPYSYLFGVPLSLLGLIFYIGVLGVGIGLSMHVRHAKNALYIAAVIGMLLSFCFSCIQIFLIGAWCIYCIFSALICIVLFIMAIVMWRTDTARKEIAAQSHVAQKVQ